MTNPRNLRRTTKHPGVQEALLAYAHDTHLDPVTFCDHVGMLLRVADAVAEVLDATGLRPRPAAPVRLAVADTQKEYARHVDATR